MRDFENNIELQVGTVDIGAHNIYYKLFLNNNNTFPIVMDAGYGADSETWTPVVERLTELSTVLIYDRAGLGLSGNSNGRRTSMEMIRELKGLIDILHLNKPYVLVGHSFGAINSQLLASCFPKDIASLILLDPAHEDHEDKILPLMGDEFRDTYYKQFTKETTHKDYQASMEMLRSKRTHLGNIPVKIISAGKKKFYDNHVQNVWLSLHKELLTLSNNSDIVIAKNSAHHVHHDEPELVIREIREIFYALKRNENEC